MLLLRILAVSLVGAAALLMPPRAVAHEGGGLVVVAEPDHGPRGATVTVTGDDFFPGHALDIRFVVRDASESIGAATVGEDGHFTAEVRLPPDAPLGVAAIDVVTPAGIVGRVLVTVDPGPVVGTPASVPAGGNDAVPTPETLASVVAVAVIVTGVAVALLRVRARSPREPEARP